MKNAIFALLVALSLGAMLIGYASVSFAQRSDVTGNYIDERSEGARP